MTNNAFTQISLIYNILVLITFFSKDKIKSLENKIYGFLLITNFANIVFAIFSYITILNRSDNFLLCDIVSKLLLVLFSTWVLIFTLYVFIISFKHYKNFDKFYAVLKKLLLFVYLIVAFAVSFLKLDYFSDKNVAYSFGASANVVYVLTGILIVSWIIMSLLNFKEIKTKKYLPVYLFIVLVICVVIVQKINPALLLITAMETFITALMYFTIENPDLKMVGELYKNKNIMEQTYEDKSNFLFEMTQEVRMPVTKIHEVCTNLKEAKSIKDYSDSIAVIDRYSRELDYIINDILNVNSMDLQNVKFIDNKYDFRIIYNEIVKKMETVIPSKVTFTPTMVNNLPTLYGDGLKLKQIIYSMLMYSVKRTTNGYIELSVNSIERFDAVRLIITIRDSGSNISMDKINEILSATGAISKEDIELMEKSEISMELCQKVIKLLGGHLLIRNNERGGEIIMTVDQKIDERRELNVVDAYERSIAIKNVAVVNQDKEVTKNLRSKFKESNINGTFLLNGNDLIDVIKGGKKFDYILVQNEMKEINGYTIKQKLEEIDNFNIPVIIMVDEKSESLKKHFIEDGFKDYLLLSNFNSEVDRIMEKY